MITAKRLYLYGVLCATLIPLLWGLADLLQVALRGLAAALGSREVVGADILADQVSWALALVVVALPVWAIHLGLVRRSLQGAPDVVAEERASLVRATYFFLVALVTAAVSCLALFELAQGLVGAVVAEQRPWGVAGAAAGLIVVGSAWLGHVSWRRADFLAVPDRTAGDWLTRAYLYGGLFVVAVLAAFWLGVGLSVVARELVGLEVPAWDVEARWPLAIVTPAAGAIAASTAWLIQSTLAGRLLRADPPIGEAHRASRTRSGYFLAVVLASATASLVLVSQSLGHVFAEILGVWRSAAGSRIIEDVGGPLLIAIPFLVAWWWHLRRASGEALAFHGPDRGRAVTRCGRMVVAFVGLAGLAVGAAWSLSLLLTSDPESRALAAEALATALVGSTIWLSAWLLAQRERARLALEVAASTARRVYLLLVSGLAVVAVMGSLAHLVYQVTRMLTDAGPPESVAQAGSVLLVAGMVLAYHLVLHHADGRLVAESRPLQPEPIAGAEAGAGRVLETIEISAPAGSDLAALNAAIRRHLPADCELRVISASRP